MKLASKWIVVPYNSHLNKSENILTPKEKIEKIVNNSAIVDTDKLNLINQILLKNIKPVEKSEIDEKQNTNDTTNFQFINEDFLLENTKEKKEIIPKEKKKTKKLRNPEKQEKSKSKKKKADDIINQTFENIQHYLPPHAATRNQTNQFLVPVVHLAENENSKRPKKRKLHQNDDEEDDEFQDANTGFLSGNGIKWSTYVKKR
jgi:hypothetical protein